jgi:hypothetical protein
MTVQELRDLLAHFSGTDVVQVWDDEAQAGHGAWRPVAGALSGVGRTVAVFCNAEGEDD